jgi:hypothetical protein
MKIRILRDAHHRISSGLSQSFKAESEPNVPKATANALIRRGVAKAIKKPSEKGD